MLQAYANLVAGVLESRVNAAAAALTVWAAFETFRTYYVWRGPDDPAHEAVEEILGLLDERREALRHRNIEFVILAFVVTAQGALWLTESVLLARWFAHAVCFASLLTVGSGRRRAYDRIDAAHVRAIELLDQATRSQAQRQR